MSLASGSTSHSASVCTVHTAFGKAIRKKIELSSLRRFRPIQIELTCPSSNDLEQAA
ncbi:MAG: hypothetical protein P1U72_16440 [Paracoccaceae bacterium]|jgi:hypothetical protein|nr:hypothetical protein [Paracoccaceae bacterium]